MKKLLFLKTEDCRRAFWGRAFLWLIQNHYKVNYFFKERIICKSTIKLAPERRLEKPTFNQKITFVVFCILQELSLSFLHLMLLSLLRKGSLFFSRVEETFNKDYFFIWCFSVQFRISFHTVFFDRSSKVTKGQIISETNFQGFIWTHHRSKIFLYFWPSLKNWSYQKIMSHYHAK